MTESEPLAMKGLAVWSKDVYTDILITLGSANAKFANFHSF